MKIFDQYKGLSKEVYIVCTSKLLQTMGAFIWPLFVLILQDKVKLTEGEITIYLVISMIVGLVSSLLGGLLSDKFGKKRTIVVFEFLAMISFLSIIFFDIGIITALLLMVGMFFFGLSGPSHEALLANVTKTEERESAYSLIYLALNLGVVIGPAVGAMLLENHFNLFITIDVLTTFTGWLLLVLFVKEKNVDVIVNEFEREAEGSLFRIILDRPVIIFYGILAFFTSFAYGQLDLTLPLYVNHLFEEGVKIFGFLYSTNGLTVVLGTAFITYILRKKSALNKIFIGFTLYVFTFFVYSLTESLYIFFILMIIFTIGEIIISIGVAPILSKIVPTNILGRIAGAMTLFYMSGHMAATILTGSLIESGYSFRNIWLIVATVSLFGYVYFFFFKIKYGSIIDKVDSLDKNRQ
ncbi:MFS transporter [Mycoplasmatota bacterium WC44]